MSDQSSTQPDLRLAAVHDLLGRILDGEAGARIPAAGSDDLLDQIIAALNRLAAEREQAQAAQHASEHRAAQLLDTMMAIAAEDYTVRAPVGDGESLFDALASGLNMLADEFLAAQAEHARLQEEIIQTQAAVIAELSTPLIPITDEILVMPLVGSIDSRRAQHILERLLEGVAANRTHTVIMDITGVTVVDTQVADTLVRAAQAVRLLGTEVYLTGMRPEVAQTLVNLGVDLRGLAAWSTMQMGIAHVMRRTGLGRPRSLGA